MSTKIHDGYKVLMDFDDLYRYLQAFSVKANEIGFALYCRQVFKMAVSEFDKVTLGQASHEDEQGKRRNLVAEAQMAILERQNKIETTSLRDPQVDFECKILLFPIEPFVFLCRVFSEHTAYEEEFVKGKNIWSFNYWNNTDRPSFVSEQEWHIREREWDKAFDLSRGEQGGSLVYKAVPNRTWEIDESQYRCDAFPLEDRIKDFAKEMLIIEKWDKEKGLSQCFSILSENQERLDELKRQLTNKIKPTISFEDLWTCSSTVRAGSE